MTTQDQQQLAADAIGDLQRYNDAFIQANRDSDPTLMRPWMRLPVIRYRPDGATTVATTLHDIDAMYGAMIDSLADTGYHHSVLSDFQVDLINPGTALIRCHGERLRADGSAVQTFDTAYILARGDHHWQISALLARR